MADLRPSMVQPSMVQAGWCDDLDFAEEKKHAAVLDDREGLAVPSLYYRLACNANWFRPGSGRVRCQGSGQRGQSVKVRGTAGHPLSCEAEAGMEAAGRKHLGGQKDK